MILTFLGGFIAAYFTGLLNQLLPSPQKTICYIREWIRLLRRSRKPNLQFRIIVCTLDHDTDGSQTRHVQYAFSGQKAFEVIHSCQVLNLEYGDTESEIDAQKKGQSWIKKYDADLLIFGDVAQKDQVLRLWFLSREGSTLTQENKPYTLEKTELPANFKDDFASQLVGIALSSIGPVTEKQGTYLVDTLLPVAAQLDSLRKNPPSYFTPLQRATLQHSFALAADTIGLQKGENQWLEEAVAAYRLALEEYTRERMPLNWAQTQNNLGNALSNLSERESGTARLEEAVAAYRLALEEYTRERVPLNWAQTQNNLGSALRTLGERESGTARLEEAVAAYRLALEERTRERVPLFWAMTQNNLGIALLRLGERERNPQLLEESIMAFRTALEVVKATYYQDGVERNLNKALSKLEDLRNQ